MKKFAKHKHSFRSFISFYVFLLINQMLIIKLNLIIKRLSTNILTIFPQFRQSLQITLIFKGANRTLSRGCSSFLSSSLSLHGYEYSEMWVVKKWRRHRIFFLVSLSSSCRKFIHEKNLQNKIRGLRLFLTCRWTVRFQIEDTRREEWNEPSYPAAVDGQWVAEQMYPLRSLKKKQ